VFFGGRTVEDTSKPLTCVANVSALSGRRRTDVKSPRRRACVMRPSRPTSGRRPGDICKIRRSLMQTADRLGQTIIRRSAMRLLLLLLLMSP